MYLLLLYLQHKYIWSGGGYNTTTAFINKNFIKKCSTIFFFWHRIGDVEEYQSISYSDILMSVNVLLMVNDHKEIRNFLTKFICHWCQEIVKVKESRKKNYSIEKCKFRYIWVERFLSEFSQQCRSLTKRNEKKKLQSILPQLRVRNWSDYLKLCKKIIIS